MKTTSWGLRELDDLIGTGFPGRLVVLGARPSNGKTTWMLNWLNMLYSMSASDPHRILCFWTEHTREIAFLTWACLRYGVPLDPVIKGEWDELPAGMQSRLYTERCVLEWEELDERVRFVCVERPTVKAIVREVEAYGPDVLIFDYIQRVKPDGRQTKFEALAEAAVMFRELALSHQLLAVVGSQLKRRGDGVFDKYRPPHMEDFKGAGEIEEAANIALGLFRPLQRMTAKESNLVRAGELDLRGWQIPQAMAIKCLKHHYWPDAADRIVRVRCRDGRVLDWDAPPPEAGDAWEPEALPAWVTR